MENKTWKPTVAGILSIAAGIPGIIIGLIIGVIGGTIGWIGNFPMVPNVLGVLTAPIVILGIISIIGGIYALKRQKWGLALAGSICALFPGWILGILAIIFVVMGRDEFEQSTDISAD